MKQLLSITVVYDATGQNAGSLPPNASYAGYVTGSGVVPWSADQLKKFPDLVRIAQSPDLGIDEQVHADVLDVEAQAATLADCGPWAQHELAAFKSVSRTGQRTPVIYMSGSNVTNVVNALNASGITSGVGLWVANWNLTEPASIAEVVAAAGPFPIVAVQYHNAGTFDLSVFSTTWLTTRSGATPVVPPPAKPITQANWRWCHKCQGLFYGPNESASFCPAGGRHNGSNSGSYSLNDMA